MSFGRAKQVGAERRTTRAAATSNGPGRPARSNYDPAPTKIGPKHLNWFQFEWQAADGRTVTHAVGDEPIRSAR